MEKEVNEGMEREREREREIEREDEEVLYPIDPVCFFI